MSVRIPSDYIDLLEGQALAHLATTRADGTPHVTPVWIDHDGDSVLVDVRVDRVKAANMRARRAVALSIVDPAKPGRYIAVSGHVVSWSEDGWREHMDTLARRYLKVDKYPLAFDGERRAIFRIEVDHVYTQED